MQPNRFRKSLLAGVISGLSSLTYSADIPLYPTGPSQDSAFIRFINGTNSGLTLQAKDSKAKLVLDLAKPTSQYYPVNAKERITGEFSNSKTSSKIALTVKPGEFANVIALSNGDQLKQVIIKEQPSDFNSLKSSIALYNLIATDCSQGGLTIVDRSVFLLEKVKPGTVQRRLINPVRIAVQLSCNGLSKGNIIPLENLQAGERYSIFAVQDSQGVRIFSTTDTLAH